MKKNISINISGIIFHIEEDGYEVLKKYLDSINKYFSSFEDSSEILSDIESRIAEIFLSKLNEGKQIITFEDVNSLVATMGSVSDFKAAEEQEFSQTENASQQAEQQAEAEQTQSQRAADKQLYRDQARKILGGVCAGLGNYFNVDAVWVRLFFALLTFAWGFGILVYIILWIAIPGSYTLEDVQGNRKLFRDNERRVIGGVSGGLAAYFGFDIVVIRLLFVATAFVGFGIVAYIVLWMVLSPAVSITDKMEMQGEPVTLSNIESNLKKNLNVKENEENVFVKILLFPFRLIGMILTGLGKLIYPLIEVLRVAIGVCIAATGFSLLISVIVMTGFVFGIVSGDWVHIYLGAPFHDELVGKLVRETVPTLTLVAATIGALIPGLMIMLLGISVIAKRIVFNAVTGWSLFALFLASTLVLSFTIPKIVMGFKEEGRIKMETFYPADAKRLVFKVNEIGMDDYIRPEVRIKGYSGKEVKIIQTIESMGYSRKAAIENTKMVDYKIEVKDSLFIFDSNLTFKKDATFRGQSVDLLIYVPYNYPFYIDEDFRLISNYNYYTDDNPLRGNTWIISEKTQDFECLSCPVVEKSEEEAEAERLNAFSEYTNIEISGSFDVTISQDQHTHSISINGEDDEEKKYKITQVGKTLKIEYRPGTNLNWLNGLNIRETEINITVPTLERLKLQGNGDVTIKNFHTDDLELDIYGRIKADGDLNAERLNVTLEGSSKFEVRGSVTSVTALIQGASKLEAYDLMVDKASVEVVGMSFAEMNVSERLAIRESGASKVSYTSTHAEIIKK